jgi:hypothetical protein
VSALAVVVLSVMVVVVARTQVNGRVVSRRERVGGWQSFKR